MLVADAIQNFTNGECKNRIYVSPNIPAKKLNNARARFISRDEPILVLVDDTLFGSGKDGLAISENYIYAKGSSGDVKSVKISSIRSISSQSNSRGILDVYIGASAFITLHVIVKEDHDFLLGIFNAARSAAQDKKIPIKNGDPVVKKVASNGDAFPCTQCTVSLPAGAKFCLECGAKVIPRDICQECNTKLPAKAKFCLECGSRVGLTPSNLTPAAVNVPTLHQISNEDEKNKSPSNDSLRMELTTWLSAAAQRASIVSDIGGDRYLDLACTAPPPEFTSKLGGWVARYDVSINAGDVNEVSNDNCRFFKADDVFDFSSPELFVGNVKSVSYRMATNLDVYVLNERKIYEFELKDGKLSIPKLSSLKVKLHDLSSSFRLDNGVCWIDFELETGLGQAVYFEVLPTEKLEAATSVYASISSQGRVSGSRPLSEVKLGDKLYIHFGEYELLVDNVRANFSGIAKLGHTPTVELRNR